MKGALVGVLSGFQGLGSDDSRERPVDRLGAVGASQITEDQRERARAAWEGRNAFQAHRGKSADRGACYSALGVDVVRFKWANVPAAKSDAEGQLAAMLAWPRFNLRLSERECLKVARQALMEHTIDFCPRCRGAKEVPDHSVKDLEGRQPMKSCPSSPEGCGGTGKRHYPDAERIASLGAAFADALFEAHAILTRAEGMAVENAARLLERWR